MRQDCIKKFEVLDEEDKSIRGLIGKILKELYHKASIDLHIEEKEDGSSIRSKRSN